MEATGRVMEGYVTSDSTDDDEGMLLVPKTLVHGDAREPEGKNWKMWKINRTLVLHRPVIKLKVQRLNKTIA
jgi:hypothetical protein